MQMFVCHGRISNKSELYFTPSGPSRISSNAYPQDHGDLNGLPQTTMLLLQHEQYWSPSHPVRFSLSCLHQCTSRQGELLVSEAMLWFTCFYLELVSEGMVNLLVLSHGIINFVPYATAPS